VSAPAVRRSRAKRGSGDLLRQEIVEAAKGLLAEAGSASDVPLRAVADAVGVTTPSIYLHFADKQELLGAVVAGVFGELDHAMVAAAAEETTPMGRLRAFGLAYVRFALEHPEHYRLAMLEPCPEPNIEVDEVLHSSAFSHMQATVEECIDAGIFQGDPLSISFEMWAAAHGVAALMIAKPYLPFGEAEDFADRTLCAAAIGHAVRPVVGDKPGAVAEWLARHRP
jgi:AcrR family transcriptional regulator